MIKPYHKIPIQDCGEPLIPIPLEVFAVASPHPYEKLGAPYPQSDIHSPYFVRQGVLKQLIAAQTYLQQKYPRWRLQIFDAYRPIEVQQFMVEYTFADLLKTQGLTSDAASLSAAKRQEILAQVYQFWAAPSLDPATPPPHSTGAAIDITLVDDQNQPVNMGSPIDEVSPRSYPDYFADASDITAQQYHQYRQLLKTVMIAAGFQQHPNEWWHFSLGDQMWVWLTSQQNSHQTHSNTPIIAKYGRYHSGYSLD